MLGNREMIAGDVVSGGILLGGMMFNDVPTCPVFHDDTRTSIASLRRIIDLYPAKVHVGHGGPLEIPSIKKFVRDQEFKYL